MENEITIDEVKEFLGKLQLYLGIKDEDMKKFEENSEKLFCNTAENFAKEFLNG